MNKAPLEGYDANHQANNARFSVGGYFPEDEDSLDLTQAFSSREEGGWDNGVDDFGAGREARPRRARHARVNVADGAAPAESSSAEANAAAAGDEAMTAFYGGSAAPVGASDSPSREIPEYLKRSKRMRKVLTVVAVILVLALAAAGWFAYQLFNQSQQDASSQTLAQQEQPAEVEAIASAEVKDTVETVEKVTSAPNLPALLGLTQDQAVAKLGTGAKVTTTTDKATTLAQAQEAVEAAAKATTEAEAMAQSTDAEKEARTKAIQAAKEATEKAAAQLKEVQTAGAYAVCTEVRVSLTGEPVDAKVGYPVVFLGLNNEGSVVEAGYTTSTTSLGYGAVSFSELVSTQHVVEATFREAGVALADGAAVLPADKSSYTTYVAGGSALASESCSFSGAVTVDGQPCEWSAVLSYDYSTANLTGEVGDTVRIIYVYLTATDNAS